MPPIIQKSWVPKPQPQQTGEASNLNKPQSLQAAAANITRQLQSNPAFLRQVSEKFKAEASREARSSGGVSTMGSSFSVAAGSSGEVGEVGFSPGVKRHERAEVAPRIRRANLNALSAVENLAPALGGAAGSPEVSAEVGSAAGLKGTRKGGGVLGAVVARELSFGAQSGTAAQEAQKAKAPGLGLKAPIVFVNNVHQPILLGPAPRPRPARASERTPEAEGQRRLNTALHETTGRIAEFLRDSNVGKMLKAVDGLQEALATKATERLRTERFFLQI
jgi:hypothetical protein